MAWPTGPLPVVVEIAPGADLTADPGDWTWQDVTAFARIGDGIAITAGRGDWGDQVDPGSCKLVFNNPDGDFSQYNPLGQWYGQLGRDTPLRVRLRRLTDAFGRTASGGWGTADSGQTYSTAGGAAGNYEVSAGQGRITVDAVSSSRNVLADVDLADAELYAEFVVDELATGGSIEVGLTGRWTSSANTYMAEVVLTTGQQVWIRMRKIVDGSFSTVAASVQVSGLTHTTSTVLGFRFGIAGTSLHARVWDTTGDEPTGWQVEATDTDLTGPGAWGFRGSCTSTNTNQPFTIAFDNAALHVDLFGGYVPAWVPRTDRTGTIRTVPVTARGVLHRLKPSQGNPPARSPMYRTILGSDPAGYWPVEDGALAGQAASAIPGHPPLTVAGVTEFIAIEDRVWNGQSYPYGSAALADLSGGGRLSVTVPADVTTATASGFGIDIAAAVEISTASADVVLAEWTTPGGTYTRWQLVWTLTSTVSVKAITGGGVSTDVITTGSAGVTFNIHDVSLTQNGANIDVGLYWGTFAGSYSYTGSVAGTLAGVTGLTLNATAVTNTEPFPVGHVAIRTSVPPSGQYGSDIDDYGAIVKDKLFAWSNETAHDRLVRLAAEDGITVTVDTVDPGGEVRMGDQADGTPTDLYQQCVDADGGVLYETPFGLAYRPRATLYNQDAALTLTATQLDAAPEPDGSLQAYRNRWEVKRVGGSSAVAQADEVGTGAVVRPGSVDLALADDTTLADQAGWRLHVSSDQGLRWPQLEVNFEAVPTLLDAWLSCRIGSRITVTDVPEDVAGAGIDVILEGYTLTLGFKAFHVAANCSPAAPWTVGVYDTSRYADTASELAADVGAGTDTSMSVTVTDGPLWTTDTDDMPLTVEAGGVVLTVTAISGASSPQTFTISTTPVNGVVKTIPAGTSVSLADPDVYAL